MFRKLRRREHRTIREPDPETDAIAHGQSDARTDVISDARTDVISDAIADGESLDEPNSGTDAITDALSDIISVEPDRAAIKSSYATTHGEPVRTSDTVALNAD